jgi:hypothetical protein
MVPEERMQSVITEIEREQEEAKKSTAESQAAGSS